MAVSMEWLCEDLAAETSVLRGLVADLSEAGWERPTPAVGWKVGDQISHLAHFDQVTVQSALDPTTFTASVEALQDSGGIDPDAIALRYRELTGAQLLEWFDGARTELLAVFRGLEPGMRLPWFGPPMSAASSLTARIMETWAHGQDVADTFGVMREPTDRLRHVAHIGVGARAYSYVVHGLSAPTAPIRVELRGPSGETWSWGPDDAADRITGNALDFCLAVTQRRHRSDVELSVSGPDATRWMEIAQAFAGPAGTGREPSLGART